MFVGRMADGSIYGTWTCPQPKDEFHTNIEELPDEHPDVVAFTAKVFAVKPDPRDTKIAELEARLAVIESKSEKALVFG